MFGFRRRREAREALIEGFHEAVAAASREPALYGPGGFPDTVEGRFESLALHMVWVLRRMRALPQPAGEVAQELVDAVFAHLEIALRESGVGDFGVAKRMKKLGRAFYDRAAKYEAAWTTGGGAIATSIETRTGQPAGSADRIPAYLGEAERLLARCDLDMLLAGPPFRSALGAIAETRHDA